MRENSNSICYHDMRESVAMGESFTTHVPTGDNCADLLTKVLYESKRKYHLSNLIYDIYDDHIL